MDKKALRTLLDDILSGKELVPLFMTSGYPPSAIYRAFKGLLQNPDRPFLKKVAAKYRVDPQYLLDRIDYYISEIDRFKEINPYSILGLTYQAKDYEIHKKWKELLKTWHPDKKRGGSKALEVTQEINEAYEILRNPEARKEYDRKYMPLLAIVRDIDEHTAEVNEEETGKEKGHIKKVMWLFLLIAAVVVAGYHYSHREKEGSVKMANGSVTELLNASTKKKQGYLKAGENGTIRPRGAAGEGLHKQCKVKVTLLYPKGSKAKRISERKVMPDKVKKVKRETCARRNMPRRLSALKTNPPLFVVSNKKDRHGHVVQERTRNTLQRSREGKRRKKTAHLFLVKMAEIIPGTFPCAVAYGKVDMNKVYNNYNNDREAKPEKRAVAGEAGQSGTLGVMDKVIAVTDRYAEYYREGDCTSLFTLFSKSAVENGVPIKAVLRNYRTLFRCFKVVDFRFPKKQIIKKNDGYDLVCNYTISYRKYNQGDIYKRQGEITFSIIKEEGLYLINKVVYKGR